jgi:hypothetical protein
MSDDPIDAMTQSTQQILFALGQTVQHLARLRERREQVRLAAAQQATRGVIRRARARTAASPSRPGQGGLPLAVGTQRSLAAPPTPSPSAGTSADQTGVGRADHLDDVVNSAVEPHRRTR